MDSRLPSDWRSQTPPLSKLTWSLLDLSLSFDPRSPDQSGVSPWSSEELTALRHSLTRLLLDREALAWHVRSLQRLRQMRGTAWPSALVEPLPQAQLEQILAEGVATIKECELSQMLLNPVVLHQVADAVDETLPDAWLPLMAEHGGELFESRIEELSHGVAEESAAEAVTTSNPSTGHLPRERWAWLAACAALLMAACWLGATRAELKHEVAMLRTHGQFRPQAAPPENEPPDLPEVDNSYDVLVIVDKFVPAPEGKHIGPTGEQRLAIADAANNLDNVPVERARSQSGNTDSAPEGGKTPGTPPSVS